MQRIYIFILTLFSCGMALNCFCQTDSATIVNQETKTLPDTVSPAKETAIPEITNDSTLRKKHSPQKATRKSAILPGWGQAYNKQYWKMPIVYGALAIPASLFAYNNKWYQETKEAYNILVNNGDTSQINDKLKGLSAQTLQYYRNDFRQSRDYSVLFFLLMWGLNVVDATVSAHLKEFDVSDDLSMRIKPDFDPGTNMPSVSVALGFKDKPRKMLPSSF